jgi:acetate kinase
MTPTKKRILTMNRGSSSLKSALYEMGEREELLVSISVEQESGAGGRLKIADARGATLLDADVDAGKSNAAIEEMFRWLGEHDFLDGLAAVGHRLVHGGTRYREPVRVNAEFLREIEKIVPLDPDHLPAAIRGIQFVSGKFPELPQVACFDTAFHRALPEVARMYALPRGLHEKGIQRYGFHGLSYEFVMSELQTLEPQLANGRVIIAHLGSGASMVAVRDGKSIDTSMGFTPLEGLVMATRSGDVDPGAVIYLMGHEKVSIGAMDKLLNKESGLLGVSGTSGDMKLLLEKSGKDSRANEAVSLFCYRAKKYIGAYAAALGGLDVLVFTGGIGEKAASIRERVCDGLEFLGIRLDGASNGANAELISDSDGRVRVRVVKTNEDLVIARHVQALLGWKTI